MAACPTASAGHANRADTRRRSAADDELRPSCIFFPF